jgi:hypothetical protein
MAEFETYFLKRNAASWVLNRKALDFIQHLLKVTYFVVV